MRLATYFLNELPALADRTKSGIIMGVQGLLHTFNTGIVRELLASDTNCSLDEVFNGKWWFLDMAPAVHADPGRFVNGALKWTVQKKILKRRVDATSNIVTIWGDEAPNWVTGEADSTMLAEGRSHLGCMVYMAQSLSSYYQKLGGTQKGKYQADAMLANFSTKIFHALGDENPTGVWASA